MESRIACRYFSCSRLLDESEDEAGAKKRKKVNDFYNKSCLNNRLRDKSFIRKIYMNIKKNFFFH